MNQKGFTLIEILVAMAIGGMVMTGVLLGIFQVSWGSIRTNDQVVALTDINWATLWLKKDLQMAQRSNLTDGGLPQSSVTLNWIDYTSFEEEENKNHLSIYTLSGTELVRTYDNVPRVIGRYITSIGFTQNAQAITVVITATSPGASQRTETLKFGVHMRYEVVE